MKFYVCITTHERADGSSFSKIKKAIESVKNQLYPDWKIVIIGDGYKNKKEFDDILALVPDNKLLFSNLDKPYEKEVLKFEKQSLWCSGGCYATNLGIDLILKDGGSIRCHLDDDDEYLPHHLSLLHMAYSCYIENVFVYTNSFYRDRNRFERLFPEINVSKMLEYNNLPPLQERLVHSSASWKVDKVPLRYRNVIEQGRIYPGDADMWQRMNQFCLDNNLKTMYIPITTVLKHSEADILK